MQNLLHIISIRAAGKFFHDHPGEFANTAYIGDAKFFFFRPSDLLDLFGGCHLRQIGFDDLQLSELFFGEFFASAFFVNLCGFFALFAETFEATVTASASAISSVGFFAFGDQLIRKSCERAAQRINAKRIFCLHSSYHVFTDLLGEHGNSISNHSPPVLSAAVVTVLPVFVKHKLAAVGQKLKGASVAEPNSASRLARYAVALIEHCIPTTVLITMKMNCQDFRKRGIFVHRSHLSDYLPTVYHKVTRDTISVMEILIVLLLLVVIALLGYSVYWVRRTPQDSQSMLMLQQHIKELERSMDTKLGEGTDRMFDNMRQQFGESQKLVTDIRDLVTTRLTEVAREQTKTNEATSKFVTIAEQLGNLEKVLTHQKQRGNWGEASLEIVLGGFLPPNAYKMQYQFPNGETVDAVIFTKDGIIPVDAKFSLDNYARLVNAVDERQREELEKAFKNDLKLRIDETAKYVREKDGTLPIAFMYIPAEAIYYDLLVGEVNPGKVNARNLIDYAYRDKRVIIASPTTFMAYLSMVANGMKAFKVEENFKEIQKNVESLGRHLKAYEDYYKKVG